MHESCWKLPRILARAALLVLAVGLLTAARPEVVFVNVNVVSMVDDVVVADQVVVVSEDRIVAVGSPDSVDVPEGARIIDAHRGYLIPGLVDMHVHVYDESDLLLFLASGVTTVRGAHGSSQHTDWRDAVVRGQLLGPTQYTSGPTVSGVSTVEEAARVAGHQAAAGFDCLKIYDDVSAEVYSALVQQARRHGLIPMGHIPRNLTWQDMLQAAPASVDHAEEFLYSPLSGEDIPGIAQSMKVQGIALITTLTNYDRIGRQIVDLEWMLRADEMNYYWPLKRREWSQTFNPYANAFNLDQLEQFRRLLRFQKRFIGRLHGAGVTILLGTDAGNATVLPGFSALDELDLLVQSGLSPFDALRAATVEPAAFLGGAAEFGTIEVGKRADLVLVMGNPLEDVSNVRLQRGVMVRGRWLSRDELVIFLDDQAIRFGNEEWLVTLYELEGFRKTMDQLTALALAGDEEFPVRRAALNELAYQILLLEDQPADAVELFDFITRLYPEEWGAFDGLGDAHRRAGDLEAAAGAYRQALRLSPEAAETREKLVRLNPDSGAP